MLNWRIYATLGFNELNKRKFIWVMYILGLTKICKCNTLRYTVYYTFSIHHVYHYCMCISSVITLLTHWGMAIPIFTDGFGHCLHRQWPVSCLTTNHYQSQCWFNISWGQEKLGPVEFWVAKSKFLFTGTGMPHETPIIDRAGNVRNGNSQRSRWRESRQNDDTIAAVFKKLYFKETNNNNSSHLNMP